MSGGYQARGGRNRSNHHLVRRERVRSEKRCQSHHSWAMGREHSAYLIGSNCARPGLRGLQPLGVANLHPVRAEPLTARDGEKQAPGPAGGSNAEALLGGFAHSRAHGPSRPARSRRQLRRRLPRRHSSALKDLKIALETGSASGTPLPATALIQELYGILAATGRADLDNSSLALLAAEMAGIEGGGKP